MQNNFGLTSSKALVKTLCLRQYGFVFHHSASHFPQAVYHCSQSCSWMPHITKHFDTTVHYNCGLIHHLTYCKIQHSMHIMLGMKFAIIQYVMMLKQSPFDLRKCPASCCLYCPMFSRSTVQRLQCPFKYN